MGHAFVSVVVKSFALATYMLWILLEFDGGYLIV